MTSKTSKTEEQARVAAQRLEDMLKEIIAAHRAGLLIPR